MVAPVVVDKKADTGDSALGKGRLSQSQRRIRDQRIELTRQSRILAVARIGNSVLYFQPETNIVPGEVRKVRVKVSFFVSIVHFIVFGCGWPQSEKALARHPMIANHEIGVVIVTGPMRQVILDVIVLIAIRGVSPFDLEALPLRQHITRMKYQPSGQPLFSAIVKGRIKSPDSLNVHSRRHGPAKTRFVRLSDAQPAYALENPDR